MRLGRNARHSRLFVAVLLAAVAVACAPGGAPGRPGGGGPPVTDPVPVSPISHEGRWMVDAAGRVLMLRGMNFVMKGAPYDPAAAGFDEDDIVWLKDHGVDAVRLGVTGTGVMPAPGDVDETLLDRLQVTVDLLAEHEIYVLLDLHQDGWGERADGEPLGSDGFPEWMTVTNGATNTHTGFPLYYVTNPAIQAAFQSLWDNVPGPDGVPLQTSVARMFGALAERFGDNPWVLGYDVFNEPWPGVDNWTGCVTPPDGCAYLDRAYLDPLYAEVTAAIREHDADGLVMGEPFVLFNFGQAPTAMGLPGGDANSGMAFHMYTVDPAHEPAVVDHALDWAAQTGGALLATEWGAVTDPAAITRQADLLDGAMIPWMYWAYNEGVVHDTHQPPAGDNLSTDQIAAIVRPHPVAVAGTPTAFTYDAEARVLDVAWDAARPDGGRFPPQAVTSVSLPALTYPDGYTVTADGARVTSDPCATTLTLTREPHAASASIRVTPGGDCGAE